MKKLITLVILLGIVILANGQAKFDKGYYVDNQDVRIECLIKNIAWMKTPAEFTYKITELSEPVSASPSKVKEFGIYDGNRFISKEVMIDVSSDDSQNLSDQRNPIWSKQRIFLEVLVEGEASLYHYRIPGLERFFFKMADTSIQQLVYKRFRSETNLQFQIETNYQFRNQILNALYGPAINVTVVEKLNYELDALSRLFVVYNRQKKVTYSVYHRKHEKGVFHFRITPGLNLSAMSVENITSGPFNYDFGTQVGFRIGIEPELIFPYTNKRLAIVIEPTFQYFNSRKLIGDQAMVVKLYTIEFPIGLRYYVFTSKNLSLFLNGFFIPQPTIHPNSEIIYEGTEYPGFKMKNSFAGGLGLNWKKFGAEFRYYTNRKPVETVELSSKYTRMSLILGFRIL